LRGSQAPVAFFLCVFAPKAKGDNANVSRPFCFVFAVQAKGYIAVKPDTANVARLCRFYLSFFYVFALKIKGDTANVSRPFRFLFSV